MPLPRTVRTSFLCKFLSPHPSRMNQPMFAVAKWGTYLGSAAAASYYLLRKLRAASSCKPTKPQQDYAASTYCTLRRLILYFNLTRIKCEAQCRRHVRMSERWKQYWRFDGERTAYINEARCQSLARLGSAQAERERQRERESVWVQRVRNWESGQSAEWVCALQW